MEESKGVARSSRATCRNTTNFLPAAVCEHLFSRSVPQAEGTKKTLALKPENLSASTGKATRGKTVACSAMLCRALQCFASLLPSGRFFEPLWALQARLSPRRRSLHT